MKVSEGGNNPALCRGRPPFRTSSYGLAASVLEISDREARSTVARLVEDEVHEASVSEVASAGHIPAGLFGYPDFGVECMRCSMPVSGLSGFAKGRAAGL